MDLWKCEDCGATFPAVCGRGIVRCEDCDRTQEIDPETWVSIEGVKKDVSAVLHPFIDMAAIARIYQSHRCTTCGGQLSESLTPRCLKCRSRNTKKDRSKP